MKILTQKREHSCKYAELSLKQKEGLRDCLSTFVKIDSNNFVIISNTARYFQNIDLSY